MAVVITVAQQKGGSGKTMIAANLAAALAGSKATALLDIDPQHSLTRWHQLRASRDSAAEPSGYLQDWPRTIIARVTIEINHTRSAAIEMN